MKIEKQRWNYLWNEWIKPILVAAIFALFIRTFIIQPFKIPSGSMYPTLKPGDRIFVSKLAYGAKIPFTPMRVPGFTHPKSGDIVVFYSSVEKKKYLIKRFIAAGGDTVLIKDGKLFVNEKEINNAPFGRFFYHNMGEHGGEKVTVPEGNFYVLGDNSTNSQDSRYWGFVPEKNLVGRAVLIHWPVKRIRLLRDGD
ncbi:MAG: signal peptidase I [Candidatus Omnitrophota bacterium]